MKITIIGAGNMGGAIAAGAVGKGIVEAGGVTIADPRSEIADSLASQGIRVRYEADNGKAVEGADLVIVAVKPWLMEQVLGGIASQLDRGRQALASIAAGVTFDQLGKYLDEEKYGPAALYRVIPNTAISIGRSVTFISKHGTSPRQDEQILRLFGALGDVFQIGEGLMAAGTALASSGIAYAFRYVDAAARGGVAMGFSEAEALKVVLSTVKGAVAMLEAGGGPPQSEIDKVTTPGGITLKGLQKMEEEGFSQAVIDGLLATK